MRKNSILKLPSQQQEAKLLQENCTTLYALKYNKLQKLDMCKYTVYIETALALAYTLRRYVKTAFYARQQILL